MVGETALYSQAWRSERADWWTGRRCCTPGLSGIYALCTGALLSMFANIIVEALDDNWRHNVVFLPFCLHCI